MSAHHCTGASVFEALPQDPGDPQDAFWSAAMPDLPGIFGLSVGVYLRIGLAAPQCCLHESLHARHVMINVFHTRLLAGVPIMLPPTAETPWMYSTRLTQVLRGFGEGKPSAADHPFHHMNERKRRKNIVNYADEPDIDGLRHAPKKRKFSGAKRGDPSSKWSQGPMPAPVLVRNKYICPLLPCMLSPHGSAKIPRCSRSMTAELSLGKLIHVRADCKYWWSV